MKLKNTYKKNICVSIVSKTKTLKKNYKKFGEPQKCAFLNFEIKNF